jgi:type I restriction enzyme S subunit
MTRVGAMIGEAALIDRDLDFAFYVSLALIRPTEETLLPEFLVHWLNSPGGLSQSRGQTLGKGHSQGNLNLKLLRRFDVPLPPITIQQRIVVHLDALQAKVDALKKLQAETATELDALFPSILDRAFRGEL